MLSVRIRNICDYFLLRDSVNQHRGTHALKLCRTDVKDDLVNHCFDVFTFIFAASSCLTTPSHKYMYCVGLYFSGSADMSVYICSCCSRCKPTGAYVKFMCLKWIVMCDIVVRICVCL